MLRVSPDGERIFVGDIDAGKSTLWMFRVSCRHCCIATPFKSHLPSGNSMLCAYLHVPLNGPFMVLQLQRQHEGGSSSLHSTYAFTGAFRSASTAATGTTGILISLAFAVLVVGFVVIRRRRAASTRGHANFDKKVRMHAACCKM